MAAPPAELKAIAPYLARASELEKAEPVISYWCTYYALQQAMSLGSKDPESQVYLFELMDKLESTKAAHAGEEAFTDDVAAAAYIENFGLKLFSQADTEDRKGKSTRLTARKFLAAANFLELLAIFGEIGNENRERIKYAKWKAADIAKAFREGRTPTPGPAGGLQEGEEDAADPSKVTADEARELSQEFEALDTKAEGSGQEGAQAESSGAAAVSSGVSTGAESDPSASFTFPQQPTTLPSAPADDEPDFVDEAPRSSAASAFSAADIVPDASLGTGQQPFAPNVSSAEVPPQTHQTADLPVPHAHLPSEPPAFPSAVFPSAPPTAPSQPSSPPSHSSPASSVSRTAFTSPPPAPARPPSSAPAPAPPPPAAASAVPSSVPKADRFDPKTVGDIQKHAKWAISALNYDDFDTARKELRLALAMLGE